MAKSKIEVKIEREITQLEQEADELHYKKREVLAKLKLLYSLMEK
jgi:hypothetical protein